MQIARGGARGEHVRNAVGPRRAVDLGPEHEERPPHDALREAPEIAVERRRRRGEPEALAGRARGERRGRAVGGAAEAAEQVREVGAARAVVAIQIRDDDEAERPEVGAPVVLLAAEIAVNGLRIREDEAGLRAPRIDGAGRASDARGVDVPLPLGVARALAEALFGAARFVRVGRQVEDRLAVDEQRVEHEQIEQRSLPAEGRRGQENVAPLREGVAREALVDVEARAHPQLLEHVLEHAFRSQFGAWRDLRGARDGLARREREGPGALVDGLDHRADARQLGRGRASFPALSSLLRAASAACGGSFAGRRGR